MVRGFSIGDCRALEGGGGEEMLLCNASKMWYDEKQSSKDQDEYPVQA